MSLEHNPRIVFCTTCKGRTEHLQRTLPESLAANAGYANCKFVVLDYGDSGELHEYFRYNHQEEPRLVVYRHDAPGAFHVSHAKNMAARCGMLEGADILVTLDADNTTGMRFAQFVADKFSEPKTWPGIFLCPDFPHIQSLPYGPERPLRGFAGRLAIRAQDFIKLGGYDETFDTWRGEDIDMISRLRRIGYHMRTIPNGFLKVIPHNADVRFKEYPHARELYENKRQVPIINARTETVVNHGKFGIGAVHRNYLNETIDLKPLPTRIFGIGMQKTATTSLHKAFQLLGYDAFHWGTGEAPLIWQEMNANGRSSTLEQWYALTDMPIPLLYQQLDKAYPGSKFVLTVRNETDWLKSVERLWDPKFNPTRWVWDAYPFTNTIHTVMYGQKDFDAQIFLERYRRHNAEVKAYFSGRPRDLLVLDIDGGYHWSYLCDFLGAPIPDAPYPFENRTVEVSRPASAAEAAVLMRACPPELPREVYPIQAGPPPLFAREIASDITIRERYNQWIRTGPNYY